MNFSSLNLLLDYMMYNLSLNFRILYPFWPTYNYALKPLYSKYALKFSSSKLTQYFHLYCFRYYYILCIHRYLIKHWVYVTVLVSYRTKHVAIDFLNRSVLFTYVINLTFNSRVTDNSYTVYHIIKCIFLFAVQPAITISWTISPCFSVRLNKQFASFCFRYGRYSVL